MKVNFVKETTENLPNMIMEHSNHAVVLVQNEVYVFGGYIHASNAIRAGNTDAAEYFSFPNNAWNQLGDLPEQMETTGATAVQTTIYIVGNSWAGFVMFDTATKQYSTIQRIST
jgi:N-acetylneuraminic acid mutarotase